LDGGEDEEAPYVTTEWNGNKLEGSCGSGVEW